MEKHRSNNLVITADLIWLTSDTPLRDRALIVDQGKVIKIERICSLEPYLHNRTHIRKQGIVLPGFVDCHVHLGLRGNPGPVTKTLHTLKRAGIIAVRDAGDKHNNLLKWHQNRGSTLPAIVPAGKAISFKGGYGRFLGEAISNVQDGVTLIEQLADQGAKSIKLILTSLMDFKTTIRVSGPYIKSEDIRVLTKVAHTHGLTVMAHVNSDEAIKEAIDGNIDSIEHGYFIKTSSLKMIADIGIAWVPTLSPLFYMSQRENNSEIKATIRWALKGQQQALAKAFELGVRVGIGTDSGASGVPFKDTYFKELQLFEMAGISRHDVLRAASFNGHNILGLGTVEGHIDLKTLINIPNGIKGLYSDTISYVL